MQDSSKRRNAEGLNPVEDVSQQTPSAAKYDNAVSKLTKRQHKSLEDMSEGELLSQYLEENSQAVGEMLRRTADIVIPEKDMKAIINRKLSEYGIDRELRSDVADYVALVMETAKHPAVKGKDITRDITESLKKAIEKTDYSYDLNAEDRAEVDSILKGFTGRVYLNEEQEAHVREQGYDLRWLRQKLFGRLNVVKKSQFSETSETPLEYVYMALSERFPNLFVTNDSAVSSAVPSSEYAMDIVDKLDKLRSGMPLTIEEAFGENADTVATRMMSELVADVIQGKHNNKHNAYVQNIIDKQTQMRDAAVKAQREKNAQRIKREKTKARERLENQAQKIREQNEVRSDRNKKRMEAKALRGEILKLSGDVSKLLLKGTRDKNVKLELQETIADAMLAVNLDTVGAENRIKKIDAMLAKTTDQKKGQELLRRRRNIANMGYKTEQRLSLLKNAYESIKESADPNLKNAYYDYIYYRIADVKNAVGDTALADMTNEQLTQVRDLYKMVSHIIRYNNKVFLKNKQEDAEELSAKVAKEIKDTLKIKSDRPEISEKISGVRFKLLKPYYAFETVGSKTFTKMYWELQNGEQVWARDVFEAHNFLEEERKKSGWLSWDRFKSEEIELTNGKKMLLTLGQRMDIYNAAKREQYIKHIENGGYVYEKGKSFKKDKSVIKYVASPSATYRLNRADIIKISSTLTEEQRKYADALEVYLTKVMGAKGNEASRVLWGVDLFGEEHYTPIQSASEYVQKQNAPTGEVLLKNMAASKPTVPNAQNPVVLRDYETRWTEHVNQMAMYHGLVVPIDAVNKVFGYSQYINNGPDAESWSVKTLIDGALGSSAVEYFEGFIRDLNGGVRNSRPLAHIASKLFATSKKVAVASSMSTVVQQGTAVIRAMSEIDAKHFTPRADGSVVNHFKTIQKYAPVAIVKEIGGFDMGGNRSPSDYINSYKPGIKRIGKAISKDKQYVRYNFDNLIMYGAQKADELGWSLIWDAVINEQQAKYGVKLKSLSSVAREKFLKKCGDRFNEVIVKTQVYDSTFSRSAMMRSQNDWDKILTSFMGEPMTSLNMLYSAIVQKKRGSISTGQTAKTIASVYASVIAASAFASLVYAMRDDDEEDEGEEEASFLEKWAYHFSSKTAEELLPTSMMPFARDAVSIFQGWRVGRPDMDLIEDFSKSFKNIFSDKISTEDKIVSVSGAVANLFGIPLKNVIRDTKSFFNLFNDIKDDTVADWEGLGQNFARGFLGKKRNLTEEEERARLFTYLTSGKNEKAQEIKDSFESSDDYHSFVRKMLKENDTRVQEAAQAHIDGNPTERARISDEILKSYPEGFISQKDVMKAVDSKVNELSKVENTKSSEESSQSSYFTTSDISIAFDSGDTASAVLIINDIVSYKTEQNIQKGKSREDAVKNAESSVKTAVTKYWKPKYKEAWLVYDIETMEEIEKVLNATGLYEDVSKTLSSWEND